MRMCPVSSYHVRRYSEDVPHVVCNMRRDTEDVPQTSRDMCPDSDDETKISRMVCRDSEDVLQASCNETANDCLSLCFSAGTQVKEYKGKGRGIYYNNRLSIIAVGSIVCMFLQIRHFGL